MTLCVYVCVFRRVKTSLTRRVMLRRPLCSTDHFDDLTVTVKIMTFTVNVKVTHVVGQGRSRTPRVQNVILAVAVHATSTSHCNIFHVLPLSRRYVRHPMTSLPLRRLTFNYFRASSMTSWTSQ